MSDARHDQLLRDRLLRYLLRERAASRQGLHETYGLPVAARVEAGDAIAGVAVRGWVENGARLALHAPANQSGFRAGDRLRIGRGDDPLDEPEVQLVDWLPHDGTLLVEVPSYGGDRAAIEAAIAPRENLVLDRSGMDMTERLGAALARVFDGAGPLERAIRDLLARRLARGLDTAAEDVAVASLERLGSRGIALGPAQQEAFIGAWAHAPYHLVQGPPGTGKTFLLALLLAALGWRRERILVTAQTHLAVDNVLAALARIVRTMNASLRIVRVTGRNEPGGLLDGLPVETVTRAKAVTIRPSEGLVVGATLYAALPFAERAPFHRVVFDEAAQVPVPHALCALLAGSRWLFFGDDRQLGPVVVGEHDDGEVAGSIFSWLRPCAEPTLLDETFRMNEAVCAFPSRAFYDGRLRPAAPAAARRLTLAAPADANEPLPELSDANRLDAAALDELLDPDTGPVIVRIDHEGYHQSCAPEVAAVADIAEHLLVARGLPADELAIVAPFRVQNREIARELRRRLPPGARMPVVDTVERVQGQEREVVIASLTCSDPDALRRATAFFFSPNRLCVTLTRSRTKLIVVGSRHLLRTLPHDHEGLRRLDLFFRMFAELPQLEWTARYVEDLP